MENEKSWNDISLTCYNNQELDTRTTRLKMVLGYIACLANQNGVRGLSNKITNLHDHKGELTVTHWQELSEQEKDFFDSAWASSIGDGSSAVEFEQAS